MDVTKKFHVTLINRFIMAMSNQEKEKKSFSVSGFCEAILSTAEFECRLEDIQDMKAAEAKRTVWKMELKRENKEEKRSEKDESMNIEEKRSENDESMNIEEKISENDESMNIEEKRSENDESMNIEENKPEMGVDISTEQRRERLKDEKKKLVQAIDVAQEKQNDLKIVITNEETEKNGEENKKTDQTINVDGEKQNDSQKTQTEAGLIKEKKTNCDVIEMNERKENGKKDAKDIEMNTNNVGKKTTFAARISGFFRSLSCIKRQKKSEDVC
ncbi:unnamed protein product [Mytilus edulis]|uniref:Uncharacterized protein n=1 Tax=Mytilus edulis TaxID=6550 RepID=A0A8S3UQQ9_MYTED|nr:unnamed protein product [Mytilus edulis]